MHAFILAGGFATRLWPLTEQRAKPLLPVAGKPLLTHLLERIPKDMPVTVSTNAAYADHMKRWARDQKGYNIDVLIEDTGSDDQKLGALGATAKWVTEKKVDDDVLLLAGDNYIELDIASFVSSYKGAALIAAHDIGDLSLASAFGTILVEQSQEPLKKVKGFEEKPKSPKSTLVSTGCSILPKSTLPILLDYAKRHPDNIGGIFEELLQKGLPVECMTFTGLWKDIGSFKAYMELHKTLVKDAPLVDATATVDGDSRLEGSIALGPKTHVQNSVLTDCIVFGSSTINDCVLIDCIVDEGCVLKGVDLTGKMLRARTVLKRA